MNLSSKGRRKIYTDETNITIKNVRQIVTNALPVHEANATDIEILFKIAKADMDLVRVKEIRPEIDIKAIDPIASQIIDFKVGFEHGTPISYIQRANVDAENPSGNTLEVLKDDLRIATLNEMMREVKKSSKDIELANHIKKCGVGYRFIHPTRKHSGISPFEIAILNPMRTFVIYSNDVYNTPILSVTYTVSENSTKKFGAWTNEYYFEFDSTDTNPVKVTPNFYGLQPIIEYDNNAELMGSFEREIPLIDSLNVLTSDRVNDVCQQVQSILWIHNAKLDEQQKNELVDGGVIQTNANADGKDAKIQYVNAPLKQNEIQTFASDLKERILESAGVPKLSENGSNSTGEAQRVVNGWHIAESHAKASELMWRMAEDATLEVCLAIIKNTNTNINGIDTLRLSDIDYKVHRSENYDIVSRVNAFVTLADRGYDLVKSAQYCKITDDPQQFIMDSKENVDKIRFGNNTETIVEDKTVESIQPDTVAY